jgi:hypothetical protein
VAKVYFPQSFKNEDVQNLIAALTLWMRRKPDWSFDESGFCVEIDDHEVELCRDIVSKYLR